MADRRLLNAILRTSFYSFVQKVFHEVASGEPFVPNWHLEALCFALEEFAAGRRQRQAIAIPPRSLKSTAASVALSAWILGHDPTAKIIAISYSQDLADKFSAQTRQVMKSEWYRELFPGTQISPQKDTESYFRTSQGGYRYATSVGGTLTGIGGKFIIIDDPGKPDDMVSELKRQSINTWFNQTLISRLNDKTRDGILIVMQRLHENDLIGHVMSAEPWHLLKLGAIAEADERVQIGPDRWRTRPAGELLNPAREPREVLDAMKMRMGSYAFSAQYNQNPVPLDGGLVEWSWFRSWTTFERLPDKIVQSWDCASKTSLSSDFSVCITFGIYGSNFYVLDVFRRRVSFPELVAASVRLFEEWRPQQIIIEDAAAGIQLIQSLRLDRPIRMPVPMAVAVKGDKVTRMHAASRVIEQGRVFVPLSAPWLDDFKFEMVQFPQGRFDDQIDAFSQLIGREEYARINRCRVERRNMFE